MFSVFLSLFLGSVLMSAGDSPNLQSSPEKTSESAVAAAEPSGVATVVEIKGQAKAVSKLTGEERILKEGDALYLDETIATSASSSLQLEIADESLFTLSENTAIRMDAFDLDEENKDGHLTANVAKGVFRFVSGKVAKIKPENVNIEVPSGTIGIRGTIVLGEIEGEKCLVSLEAEEGDKVQHRIVFSGVVNGQKQEVEITKPGFATMIEGRGMAPKPIFELPKENRERFRQNLLPPKYLPRDAEGRPAMNPNVRDPKKYPGPMMKRDDQKKTDGPNPPNGPDGSGKENLKRFQGGKPPFAGRDKNQMEQKTGFQDPEKLTFENREPGNNFNQRPGEFGNLRPDIGSRGSQQNQGSFQTQSENGFQGPERFQRSPNQNFPGGFNRPGPAGGGAGQKPGGPPNQTSRPGGGKNSPGGAPPQKR